MIDIAVWICIIVGFIMIFGYFGKFLMNTYEIARRFINSIKTRKAKAVRKKKVDRKGLKVIDCGK